MEADETTPPQPEPGPAPVAPAPVEKAPALLTAREELMIPLRALGSRIWAGSPVLAIWILRGLWQALRRSIGASGAAESAAAPEQAATDDQGEGETLGEEPPAKKTPKATATATASFFEQLALGAVVLALCGGILGTVGPVVAHLLAPYTPGVVVALIVGWSLTAAAMAPEENDNTTENDHGTDVGEDDQAVAEEAARKWAGQRAAIWTFVEQSAAAGAAGHYEMKGRGVPVDYLLEMLRERRPLPGWERQQMLDLLDLAEIPHRDQMSFRIAGKKITPPGVHVEDLVQALGRTPFTDPRLVPDITPGAAPDPDPISPPEPTPIPGPRKAPDQAVIEALFGPHPEAPADPQPGAPDEGRTGAA